MEDRAESSECGVEKVKENEKGKEVLVVVLDTPDRTKNSQITTSTNKIEDSPVFNFLNSLSPIEPAKSIHVTQTINPLSFASIPSIFTSPHVSSLKGSRFLRRHQNVDPSKPEFASEDINLADTNETTLVAANKSDKLHINPNPDASVDESICQPSYECSKVEVELRQQRTEYAYTSSTFAPFIQEASQTEEGVNDMDQDKEATGCDWESFISNAPDLLIFESPNETTSCKKSIEPGEGFIANISNNKPVGEGSTSENPKEIDENHDIFAGCSTSNPSEIMDNERDSGLHRGVRRRCLVFEMGGAFRKRLDESSASDSSLLMQSNSNTSSSECQLIPAKDRGDSSRRVLAGIGLHLNSLATPNGYKFVAKFRTPAPQEEPVNNSTGASLMEGESGGVENGVSPVEDDLQASGYIGNEEATRSSPRKKRTKLEQAGEGESCKRCNCKKSKCLKLYCECFAAGVYCVEPCSCLDCFNKPVHEDTVLATRKQIESRNPLAFAPKVIKSSDSLSETRGDSSKTPASARHKRGCNCKKSGCLKKYCECFQGGVGCSVNCRCEGCKNVFGRKYGSRIIGTEVELAEEKSGVAEKSMVDGSLQINENQNDIEQNPDAALPATPLHFGRSSVQHPFSSKNKPPRSSFPSAGSSFGKTGIFMARSKIDKHFETVQEDEIPEFSQGGSPNGGVKSSSPNSKRVVSPRQSGLGTTSPEMRSSRKLILQSIPSFPSLTPKH